MSTVAWVVLVATAIAAIGVGIWWHRRGGREAMARPVKAVAVGDLLYSLPTLCDTLPPLENARAVSDPFVLEQDEWRQIEFVPAHEIGGVVRELAMLREFKAAQRTGVAWKSVFVRSSRPGALMGQSIRPSVVQQAVPSLASPRPLVLRTMGTLARVKGGFATELSSGVILYGHLVDGQVASLAVSSSHREFEKTPAGPILAAIRDLLHLALVDWYRSTVVG